MMMNPRVYFIYGILLSCVVMAARAGYTLANDTCQTVLIKKGATKTTAKVTCSGSEKDFDPKNQNGSYFLGNNSQKWEGEIFACLCSCHLPTSIENGEIMLINQSLHGEMLNYSCNDGYKKNERKILCYDGLLVAVPGYVEKQHINISFRQKSIPESFPRYGVFHLVVSKSDNLTETEVRSKQKVFEFANYNENDTALIYYLYNGDGYMQGVIDVEMDREVLCAKILPASRTGNLIEVIIPLVIIVIVLVASLTVALFVIKRRRLQESEGTKPKNHLEEEIEKEEKQPMKDSEEN